MKLKKGICTAVLLAMMLPAAAQKNENDMDRIERCKETYTSLFGGEALTGEGTDPEFMDILQKFIFGEVFYVGDLDKPTRALITCTTLATMRSLPQLKAHAAAALRVGVSPVQLREAIYQCAPFIDFPKTLNAIATINEVFKEKGIALPLEAQATTAEDERYEKGHAIQYPLYGDEIARKMEGVPDSMGRDVARFLTEYAFGDIYTRGGLSVEMRELLIYCILTTIGADAQLYSHAQANVKLGTTPATLVAAVVQCLPYVGFPAALKALQAITDATARP